MEKRKKEMSILLLTKRKTDAKIDLFSASEWPDVPGASPDLFRLRVDGRWFCRDGEKYTFLSLEGVSNELRRLIGEQLGHERQCFERPNIASGHPVRVPKGKLAGEVLYDLSRAATPPIQGIDGRWYIGVILIGQGTVMLPVDAIDIQ